MRIDLRALAFATAATAVLAYTLVALLLAVAPQGAAALLGPAGHLDAAALSRPSSLGGFLRGVAFWAVAAPLVLVTAGWLFNRRAREPAPRQGTPPPAIARSALVAPLHSLPEHLDETVVLRVPAEDLFAFLDDHSHLAAHMSRSSWRMPAGSFITELDRDEGRAVGSSIGMRGRVLGLSLGVTSVVTERRPPVLKAWQTTGQPKLLVIDAYRLGFGIEPRGELSVLCVFIDYRLPARGIERLLGLLLGRMYSRWCVRSMLDAAASRFEPWHAAPAPRPAAARRPRRGWRMRRLAR